MVCLALSRDVLYQAAMLFRDIIGQQKIKERFIRTVREGRIPHAQLLHGSEGVGKLSLALAYAQFISCKNPSENDSCGVCSSCQKYNQLEHPDLHFVFPVIKPAGKSTVISDDFLGDFRQMVLKNNYFGVDEWFEQIGDGGKQGMIYSNESAEIIRKLSLKTYESDYKVMVIWLPELMHEHCANKLLKILEEPPAFTLFLLVSNNPSRLLTTILSRTQQIKVDRLQEDEIVAAMQQQFPGKPETEITDATKIANGSYLRAVRNLHETAETAEDFERFTELMRKAWLVGNKADHASLKTLKRWSDEMAGSQLGRERQKKFLNYSQHLIRENYIFNLQQADLNYMSDYETAFSKNFSPFINERNVEDLVAEFALAERHVEQNVNSKMIFFDLALKTIMLLKR